MISPGGSAPQRRVPRVHRIHRITSAVHSYLRSISTAGVPGSAESARVGGVGEGRRAGLAAPFYTFDFICSRDLTYIPVFSI